MFSLVKNNLELEGFNGPVDPSSYSLTPPGHSATANAF